MRLKKTKSEKRGLKCLDKNAKNILSIGISKSCFAEVSMLKKCKGSHITGTAVDKEGLEFTKKQLKKLKRSKYFTLLLQDVSKPMDCPTNYFDFIYSRLVLHYLNRRELDEALYEMYRVLKPGAKFFIVVRSSDEWELKVPDAVIDHDEDSNITTYFAQGERKIIRKRQFLSKEQFADKLRRHHFKILSQKEYKEYLFVDYLNYTALNKQKSKKANYLIEFVVTK